jgi:hypothetical protein
MEEMATGGEKGKRRQSLTSLGNLGGTATQETGR